MVSASSESPARRARGSSGKSQTASAPLGVSDARQVRGAQLLTMGPSLAPVI